MDREADCIGGYIMRTARWQAWSRAGARCWNRASTARPGSPFEGTDTLGRTMPATGTIDPGLIFTGYTDHSVVWSLAEWDWDGVTHWGDNQEFSPAERFRLIARGETAGR